MPANPQDIQLQGALGHMEQARADSAEIFALAASDMQIAVQQIGANQDEVMEQISDLEYLPEFSHVAIKFKTKLMAYAQQLIAFCQEQQGNLQFQRTAKFDNFSVWQQKVTLALNELNQSLKQQQEKCDELQEFCESIHEKLGEHKQKLMKAIEGCRKMKSVSSWVAVAACVGFVAALLAQAALEAVLIPVVAGVAASALVVHAVYRKIKHKEESVKTTDVIQAIQTFQTEINNIQGNLEDIHKQEGETVKVTKRHKNVDLLNNPEVKYLPTTKEQIEKLQELQEKERKVIDANLEAICVELKKLEDKAYALKRRAMAIRARQPVQLPPQQSRPSFYQRLKGYFF